MAGRQLQKAMEQRPQVCITLPILVGTDGHQKMSKSLGNYIGLTDPPNEMFGKAMSIPDAVIFDYFTLATPLHPEAVETLRREVAAGTLVPMELKKRLAQEITSVFHGEAAGTEGRAYFEQTFQRRETPTEMPEHTLGGATALAQVLVAAGIAKSNGEVRRLVEQGAVSVNGEPVRDFARTVAPGDELRVGRHRFLRLVQGDR